MPGQPAAPPTHESFASLPTHEQLRRLELLARQALPLYGLPLESEVKLLNYSENATMLVSPPNASKLVLRINRPGYHPRAHIASEIDWVIALRRDTPVLTAEPIPALDGEYIQHIWHPEVPAPRNCVLMSFLDGSEPDDSNRVAAFSLLGEVTAHLHHHAERWKPVAPIRRHRWDFDAMLGPKPLWGPWKQGLGMTNPKSRLLDKLVKSLRPTIESIGESRRRFGLVHADLRTANLLVQGSRVAAIDFDDCGFSWFIYDLAAALSFLETHPDVPACIDAWLESYLRIRPLSRAERAAIPAFIMLRRMLLVAWIGSHADTAHAQAMGQAFTDDTCTLADHFLTTGTLPQLS